MFIFADASDKVDEGLLGAVAYLRIIYHTGQISWQFIMANSQVAKDAMTLPRRELSAIKLAVKIGAKIKKH